MFKCWNHKGRYFGTEVPRMTSTGWAMSTISCTLIGVLGHCLAKYACRSWKEGQDNGDIKTSTKRYEFRALGDEGIVSSGTVDIWLCTGLSM